MESRETHTPTLQLHGREPTHDSLTLLDQLIDHISSLSTGQGWNKGQPFQLFPWETRFLKGAFGSEFQGDAALTLARGAGKTSFVAAIGEATLTGPLIETQAETVIVAPSLGQGRIVFNHVKRYMGSQLEDTKRWRLWDNAQMSMIENRKTGQVLRCLGAEPKRLHGLAPKLIIIDEPAQFPTNMAEEAHSVLRTAMGKIDGSRMVALGTRPLEGQEHFFNDMLSDADYTQIHCCVKDRDPLFRKASFEKACPSLRHGMPSLLAEIQAEAKRAKKNPSLLPSFKALRLNLGTAPVSRNHLIEPELWATCEATDLGRVGGYVLGLDLSDGASMCAAAGYWPTDGSLEIMAAFPERPDLPTRGLRDGVASLYVKCEREGSLFTTPGLAVDIGALLNRVLSEWGRPTVIVADRYREKDLRQVLQAVGFPWSALVVRGMGFYHGAEDVRAFRRAALEGHIRARPTLLLRAALAEAVTISDPAGNEKLAKGTENGRRKRARDDVAAAAIIAIGEGTRQGPLASAEASDAPGDRYALV